MAYLIKTQNAPLLYGPDLNRPQCIATLLAHLLGWLISGYVATGRLPIKSIDVVGSLHRQGPSPPLRLAPPAPPRPPPIRGALQFVCSNKPWAAHYAVQGKQQNKAFTEARLGFYE